jgi:hypothetical protein
MWVDPRVLITGTIISFRRDGAARSRYEVMSGHLTPNGDARGNDGWSLPSPAVFSKLDGLTVFLAPLLPAPQSGHEPSSEQRLATGGGNAPTPARPPGRRVGLEHGLDGGRDELRGLRVDDDVPAEQYAADDLPGMRGRVVQAGGDGAGLGHTPDCRKNGPGLVSGHAGFARLLRRSPAGARPVRGSAGDRVANPSIYNTRSTPGEISPDR